MSYLKDYLELIQVVNNNYEHIDQLEKLNQMFDHLQSSVWLTEEEINDLAIVSKTTQNSHYEYKLFTSPNYQNPDNHVDKRLETYKSLAVVK